ncbi:MAG: anaerobic glycerol-3-phosphate dehydrogenase subunit GlpA [Anaerolineae bacterium]|nr:anaerobic glycerol-3-phosphate dehydrogenase subunit GlpA [Anaerolineae bacterium]MCO5205104.1 anaerobic glycerol-3-phosphate dehydrogenase subunit GlpA [Anaerolineae bacterium]
MHKLQTEVLVIGGGATGTGVVWDAALRGFKTILVERRDLTHGTTGRFHGLLHSGGRYAVKDPHGAEECIRENQILRKTHAHCIEDTSGFFVVTPEDEGDDYPEKFVAGCNAVGIPCSEIPVAEALRREPLLNPRISRVFEVPDGSADGFLAAHATVNAARVAGAQIMTYHEVDELIVEERSGERHVVGARVHNVVTGEHIVIYADIIVNAAGAWSGKLAAMAGAEVVILPSKGTMVAMNHRLVNTVINRCKMPSDGDILVPSHTVCIIGTTSVTVPNPEPLRIEPWEVQKMLDEGEKIVPGFSKARVLRAWAGVRPLFQETYTGGGRDVTRKLALLDHSQREGIKGFLTITGGKWTTFRLMAEATVDTICEHLGTQRPCTTATTPVPGAEQGNYWVGHRLHDVEEQRLQGDLICECELVTRTMLENAVQRNPALTLDDLRRDVRLGKGPCQGGFCTYRAVGILNEMESAGNWNHDMLDESADTMQWNAAHLQSPAHNLTRDVTAGNGKGHSAESPTVFNPNLLLRDFLQERWKGVTPVLWGRQLKQERLDELIYLSLMNIDHLPDDELASPVTDFYNFDTTPGPFEPEPKKVG